MTTVLDIVVLRQRRDHRRSSLDLADPVEDHFWSAVVDLYIALDFDRAAGESPYVADILQIMGKDHYCERAGHLVFAEVKEMDAACADLDPEDFACHAFRFADMLAGFADGDAIDGKRWSREHQKHYNVGDSTTCSRSRRRALPRWTGDGALPHTSRGSFSSLLPHAPILEIVASFVSDDSEKIRGSSQNETARDRKD